MGVLSTGNVTVNYTESTQNNKTVVTITSMTASSTTFSPPKKKAKKNVYLKVDGKTVVNITAKWAKKASKATKSRARTDAVLLAISNTNSARDLGNTTYIFTNGAKAVKKTIKLCVFGHYKSVKVTIPKAVSSGGVEPPTDPFDSNTADEKSGLKTYTTIASVNNGDVFLVNQDALDTYGRIERVVDFNDVDNPAELKRLGEIYLRSQQFDDLVLDVSAIDLHTLTGTIPAFNLLDQVYCYSHPHGLETTLPITEMAIRLDQADSVKYTLGEKSSSGAMSTSSAASSSDLYSKIAQIPSAKNTLDNAKTEMSRMLNARTTGYVNIIQENETSQALVISDDEDWTRSQKLWKFDMNGLGYSDSTHPVDTSDYTGDTSTLGNRVYRTGITMDGTIVADFIKTGMLEDGVGLNYWNLSTGDIQIRGDAKILNMSGENDTYTEADLEKPATLAELIAATSDAELRAKQSNAKTTTSNNILRATNVFSVMTTSSWNSGGWGKTGQGFVKVMDIDSTPNPELRKQIQIYTNSSSYKTYVYQSDVPVEPNTAYVMSCWIKGSGTLIMQAGARTPYRVASQAVQEEGAWHRYQLAFKTSAAGATPIDMNALNRTLETKRVAKLQALDSYNNAVNVYKRAKNNKGSQSLETIGAHLAMINASSAYAMAKAEYKSVANQIAAAKQLAYITANKKITISFGNGANGTLSICGMTLSRGNTSSDWSSSGSDYRTYVDALTSDDRAFTKSQLEALDGSLNQSKIFSILTRNGQAKGLFMQNNQLYVNATYIYASTMVSDLLRTNIIADAAQKNYWNLATGYLKTSNMEASNLRAEGVFQGGKTSSYHLTLSGEGLTSYPPNSSSADTYLGFVRNYNSSTKKYDVANLSLQSRKQIQLFSPSLVVSTKSFNKVNGSYTGGSTGVNADLKIVAVCGKYTSGKNKNKLKKAVVGRLKFVNGICVYAKRK